MNVTIKEVSEPKYVMELEMTKKELELLGDVCNYSGSIADHVTKYCLADDLREPISTILFKIWKAERNARNNNA